MSALVVVTSYLQLINAIELIEYRKITNVDLLVIEAAGRGEALYSSAKCDNHFSKIFFMSLEEVIRKKKPIQTIKKIIKIRSMKNKMKGYSLYILGDSDVASYFMGALVKKEKNNVYIVDDGLKTFNSLSSLDVFIDYCSLGGWKNGGWKKKSFLIGFFYGGDCSYRREAIYFTAYYNDNIVLKKEAMILNDYSFLASFFISNKYLDKDVVHFLGQPVYNSLDFNKDDFFKLMIKVRDYYSGKHIVYFSHPSEDLAGISIRLEKIGLEVVKKDKAYEYFFVNCKKRPEFVSSFYSSSSFVLSKLPQSLSQFDVVDLRPFLSDSKRSKALDNIYENFHLIGNVSVIKI